MKYKYTLLLILISILFYGCSTNTTLSIEDVKGTYNTTKFTIEYTFETDPPTPTFVVNAFDSLVTSLSITLDEDGSFDGSYASTGKTIDEVVLNEGVFSVDYIQGDPDGPGTNTFSGVWELDDDMLVLDVTSGDVFIGGVDQEWIFSNDVIMGTIPNDDYPTEDDPYTLVWKIKMGKQ